MKRITIKDIAQEAGVSLRTVSLVVNNSGRISVATRKRVMAIAEALNYRPNPMAKGLVNNKTCLFGVNLPYLDLSFIHIIIGGMERKCIELEYELLLSGAKSTEISFMDVDVPVMERSIDRLLYRRVDGIASFPDRRAIKSYEEVLRHDVPLLQLLRVIPELPCPSITVNNERGMYMAVKHLLDRGMERIGFINHWDAQFKEIADRYAGYQRAFKERDLSPDLERWVIPCDLSFQGGYEAAKILLGHDPRLEAIVTATDYAAIGAMRACRDSGKRIPEDISIIGFDDMELAPYQGLCALSTVWQPKDSVGVLAAEYLYRMVQGEQVPSIVLEPELVIRESSV